MTSKIDRLRAGEIIEIEPGRKGQLDLETKRFLTSDGRSVYVGDDEDFFPRDQEQLKLSQEKERIQGEIGRAPFGEFLYQFGNQGVAGSAKDWVNRLTNKSEDYLRKKRASQQIGQQISEESPFTSGAATVASFIPDIALTRGMSALKAAPLLTATHAGSRVLDEPGQVAGEAAIAGVGGLLFDKATNFLGKIASRRGEVRNLPGLQREATEANRLGAEAVAAENLASKQRFNLLTQDVKRENAVKMAQYETELLNRQNQMIEAKNAVDQAKAAGNLTKEQNQRLLKQYDKAKKQFEASKKELPKLQAKAQEEFSKNIVEKASKLEKAFPENSTIYTEQISPRRFIQESIDEAGLAGIPAASKAKKIINGIFPEGESFTAKSLKDKYIALETAIQKGSVDTQAILNDFKSYLGERLPSVIADNWAYREVVPVMKNQLTKAAEKSLEGLTFPQAGLGSKEYIQKKLNKNLNEIFRDITPNQFYKDLKDGSLREKIKERILTLEDFSKSFPGKVKAKAGTPKTSLQKLEDLGLKISNPETVAYENFSQNLDRSLNDIFSKAQSKTAIADYEALYRLGGRVDKTLGVAPAVEAPTPPARPQLAEIPPTPLSNPTPPLPGKPELSPIPTPSPPQTFTPSPIPELAPAQGTAERAGDLLEKSLLTSGRTALDNPFTKLAGLKYVLGKAAVPLEAAYVGAKGLTSPTAAGQAARLTFEKGGIQAIDQLAQKYASYEKGVLNDPMERRSLNKELENDLSIPPGKKAVIQSKINRGKPLNQPL